MPDLLRRLAALVLGVAEYLGLPTRTKDDQRCPAADHDLYCTCPPEGAARDHR